MRSDRFAFIDSLRGLAALNVVVFHAVEGKHIDDLLGHLSGIRFVFEHGNIGVPIFFVISGFVIAHSLYGRRITTTVLFKFMARRSVRLDPPYWFAITLTMLFGVLASHIVASHQSSHYSISQVLAHVLYLQEILGYDEISPVFWTLCLEVQFYFVYAAIFSITKGSPELRLYGAATAITFCLAFITSLLWPLGIISQAPRGSFLPLWHAFLLGVGAYWSWRDKAVMPFFVLFALSIATASVITGNQFSLVCVVTSAAIALLAYFDRLSTTLNFKTLQFFGAISYSLYLIHNPIAGATFRVGYMLTGDNALTEFIWFFVAMAACIFASWLMMRAIEYPSMLLARRISLAPSKLQKIKSV